MNITDGGSSHFLKWTSDSFTNPMSVFILSQIMVAYTP